jgi:hypothetical protein
MGPLELCCVQYCNGHIAKTDELDVPATVESLFRQLPEVEATFIDDINKVSLLRSERNVEGSALNKILKRLSGETYFIVCACRIKKKK